MADQCQALNISDNHRCTEPATSTGGLFCPFHAHQCYGLYKGYKRRNKELDDITANPPDLLDGIQLHELDVTQVDDENTLEECHQYLRHRLALLERVLRARRLHTAKFYALELDWGHENYVNQLSAQKTPLTRAIRHVVKRLAEVLHEKAAWYGWVRKLEEEEEKERDAEKKKIKQEAALYRRNAKEIEARAQQVREQEAQKQQSNFLEKAWKEMQANTKVDETVVDDDWDPIEDNIEDERDTYIHLLRQFLWQQIVQDTKAKQNDESNISQLNDLEKGVASTSHSNEKEGETSMPSSSTEPKSKSAKKKARQKARQKAIAKANTKEAKPENKEQPRPGAIHVETMAEMRERLEVGQKYKRGSGWLKKGTIDNPEEYENKTPLLKQDEINQMMDEIAEIKQLLFCRILLSHATLLPVAICSKSVEEFLSSDQVTNTDLRDLCLKMEQPNLQELRDACADFKREELETFQADDKGESVPPSRRKRKGPIIKDYVSRRIPDAFETKREKAIKAGRDSTFDVASAGMIDFGEINTQEHEQTDRIKIKVCGRSIYNYPSEKVMSRGGWLQFSVIAKDCDLEDVVGLCRGWDEFNELIVLTTHNYFPASGWGTFLGSIDNQLLFKLGFFPYFKMDKATEFTRHRQTSRSQPGPRQHAMIESRNFVCGQMNRNDPVSRRFIQYVAMQSSRMIIFVRDVQTGEVLLEPSRDELWLKRTKVGMGRASKYEWEDVQSVGPEFFEDIDKFRQWSLNFKEYYEVIIWDNEPGQPYGALHTALQELLFKAHRVQKGMEMYKPAQSILRSVALDNTTGRIYDIKPGENKQSMWEIYNDPSMKYGVFKIEPGSDKSIKEFPKEWLYNEDDRLEDQVLFPWDRSSILRPSDGENTAEVINEDDDEPFLAFQKSKMHEFERRGPDIARFIHDLDTDEEVSDTQAAEINKDWNERSKKHRKSRKKVRESDDEDTSFDVHTAEDLITDASNNGELQGSEPEPDLTESELSAFAEMLQSLERYRPLTEFEDDSDAADEMTAKLSKKDYRKLVKKQREAEKAQTEEEFNIWIDRERTSMFKECWHGTDLEPHANERRKEYQDLLVAHKEWISDALYDGFKLQTYAYKVLVALEVDHVIAGWRAERDAQLATDIVHFFFKRASESFWESNHSVPFRNSLLFNKDETARYPPDRRSPTSAKYRPKEHYSEWDKLRPRWPDYPDEYNEITRPIIAHLYCEGVIYPSYEPRAAGHAIAIKEPDRPDRPDLFFDWRDRVEGMKAMGIPNPMMVDPLLAQAKAYARPRPEARFSVLKVWSAPHFWPLMIGFEKRHNTSFMDGVGRAWEWKFVPKDMPYSEWSMHKAVSDRLKEFEYFVHPVQMNGSKVVARIDTILVMATDVDRCRFLTTAATFAVQTRPWRQEIDPWKSWFNVNIDFLEKLDKKWWE